jgi:hypothetical protein
VANTLNAFPGGAVGFIDWLDTSGCISTNVSKVRLSHDEQIPHENRVENDVDTYMTSTDKAIDGEYDIQHDSYMPSKA